jgi:two-component system phosphate regulon response regulator PhoB
MTRIVIVEDELDIASVVQDYLRHSGYETEHFADGQSALQSIIASPPDLTLLDIMLPRLDGIEVLRRAREHTAHPIIMLTARIEEVDRLLGLELGADDYVCKPFSPRELVARVGAVLRRVRPALAGEALSYADIEMDTVGHKVRRGGEVVPLGPTEFRLLKHFLEHPGWVFSRERLLDAVWGHDSDIESRTVDVHIRRLRKAINGDGNKPDIIRTVRSAGYALDSGN